MKAKIKTPSKELLEEVIGKTWFTVLEHMEHFSIESRDHGDMLTDTAGEKDVAEGRRILKAIRAVFPISKWKSKADVVDEWVVVSIQKKPFTELEIKQMRQKKKMAKLDKHIRALVSEANERTKKDNCRPSFGGSCYDGHYCYYATLNVTFGQRYLYPEHVGAGFYFANAIDAEAELKLLLEKVPELKVGRRMEYVSERKTGNRPPPNDIIEVKHVIQYELKISKSIHSDK